MPAVRDAVVANWIRYNTPLESYLSFMYLDVLGLVTTGCGNLVDPLPYALILPWRKVGTNRPATAAEVRAAWNVVKAQESPEATALVREYGAGAVKKWQERYPSRALPMQLRGGVAFGKLPGNDVYLARADIETLITDKLEANVRRMNARFPESKTWCADAQMGCLSLMWAAGPAFKYPKLAAALNAFDWATAEAECGIRDNPKRTALQRACFAAAGRVQAEGLDPDVLHAPAPVG